MVNVTSAETFMNKHTNEAYELIEQISINVHDWQDETATSKKGTSAKVMMRLSGQENKQCHKTLDTN